jgi:hypothetical protein
MSILFFPFHSRVPMCLRARARVVTDGSDDTATLRADEQVVVPIDGEPELMMTGSFLVTRSHMFPQGVAPAAPSSPHLVSPLSSPLSSRMQSGQSHPQPPGSPASPAAASSSHIHSVISSVVRDSARFCVSLRCAGVEMHVARCRQILRLASLLLLLLQPWALWGG